MFDRHAATAVRCRGLKRKWSNPKMETMNEKTQSEVARALLSRQNQRVQARTGWGGKYTGTSIVLERPKKQTHRSQQLGQAGGAPNRRNRTTSEEQKPPPPRLRKQKHKKSADLGGGQRGKTKRKKGNGGKHTTVTRLTRAKGKRKLTTTHQRDPIDLVKLGVNECGTQKTLGWWAWIFRANVR